MQNDHENEIRDQDNTLQHAVGYADRSSAAATFS